MQTQVDSYSSGERRRVDADLVYTTGMACADLPPLPAGKELEALLLPASAQFQGHAQLAKVAASSSGAGCALYLDVDGAVVGDADAFATAAALDAKMGELATNKALRGGLGLDSALTLKRATIRVDDKSYVLALDATPSTMSTVLTLGQNSGACAELLTATDILDQLLPEAVHAGELQVSSPSSNVDQELAECLMQLDVLAQTEATLANTDAFQLLKDMDTKLDAFVDASTAQLQSANVQLAVVRPTSAPVAQSLASTGATSGNVEYNPPSAQMATSIFMGFMMLTAMLLGVMFTKKQHEKRCRERYERANRAAQIHRVTLRMTQHEDDANDEEEDSLL